MPIMTVIILSAIVAAFLLFGAVLAWGEMQTRHLGHDQRGARKGAQRSNPVPVIPAKFPTVGAANTRYSKEMAPN
ncbi:MAG: hypothetical protein WA776_06735 [Xanthobacteraceae bacterium]